MRAQHSVVSLEALHEKSEAYQSELDQPELTTPRLPPA